MLSTVHKKKVKTLFQKEQKKNLQLYTKKSWILLKFQVLYQTKTLLQTKIFSWCPPDPTNSELVL